MGVTIALAGDTMLGRGVGTRLTRLGSRALFSRGVRQVLAEADLVVLNLECCISERGTPWCAGVKPFHFRAPPAAADLLAELGVDCVTLANNHALDFGVDALADTRAHLARVGIRTVGAGDNEDDARAPVLLRAGATTVGVLGVTDHPPDFAAGPAQPGVAYADLRVGVPGWLPARIRAARERADVVLVSPHWGPNMTANPVRHVRSAARVLTAAGADLVAGHSAHVFHGVAGSVLFDLGDFIDDYTVDPVLRNDHGLLFVVTVDQHGHPRFEAVPLRLTPGYTRLANRGEREWIRDRFTAVCAALGTSVTEESDRLVVGPRTVFGELGAR